MRMMWYYITAFGLGWSSKDKLIWKLFITPVRLVWSRTTGVYRGTEGVRVLGKGRGMIIEPRQTTRRHINNTSNGGVAGSPAPDNCNGGVFISASSYHDNVTSNEQTEAIEAGVYITYTVLCIPHIYVYCIIRYGYARLSIPLPYRLAVTFEVSTVRCSFHKRNRRWRYYIIAMEVGWVRYLCGRCTCTVPFLVRTYIVSGYNMCVVMPSAFWHIKNK